MNQSKFQIGYMLKLETSGKDSMFEYSANRIDHFFGLEEKDVKKYIHIFNYLRRNYFGGKFVDYSNSEAFAKKIGKYYYDALIDGTSNGRPMFYEEYKSQPYRSDCCIGVYRVLKSMDVFYIPSEAFKMSYKFERELNDYR